MKKLIIVLVIIVLGAGGFFLFSKKGSDSQKVGSEASDKTDTEAMMKEDDHMMEDGNMTGSDMADQDGLKSEEMMEKGNMMEEEDAVTITYTASGYSPASVEIPLGGSVTFVNMSGTKMWPASAMHPTHMAYPGSDIKKCSTAEQDKIFDACDGIGIGKSWSFTFNETGKWNYHDHLNPTRYGAIIVK